MRGWGSPTSPDAAHAHLEAAGSGASAWAGSIPSSHLLQCLLGDAGLEAGPLHPPGRTLLRFAPSAPPPSSIPGLGLWSPGFWGLVCPGLWVAVFVPLSVSVDPFFMCLSNLSPPSCPQALGARWGAASLGGVCTALSRGQCTAQHSDPAWVVLEGARLWPETPSWTESGSPSAWT